MPLDERTQSGTNWKKVVAGVTTVGALLYAGDQLNVGETIGNAYEGAKETVSEPFTTDVEEEANEFIEQLREEEDLSKYSDDISQTVYIAANALSDSARNRVTGNLVNSMPDSTAYALMEERTDNLSRKYQRKLAGNSAKEVVKDSGQDLWDKMQGMYNSLENKIQEVF